MRLADVIFSRLKDETSCVYMVPGGSAMFLVDALGRSGIPFVSAIHEQGAGTMALGHAMASGFGVCLTTSGPGATNAITACLAAWTDSIPVLFISGQARSETLTKDKLRTHGLQPGDIISAVHGMTKMAYEPQTSAYDCLLALDKMIALCKDGRKGPCWLSIPQDISAMEVEL
jgi:acetolactate synthase-1/2/3 large subunit